MATKLIKSNLGDLLCFWFLANERIPNTRGQALVEFTLIFILLIVITWIPADFGLALYTGQQAQNASREGARIAAADPNIASDSCTMPACFSEPAGSVLRETAARLSEALLPGATIDLNLEGGTGCNRMVTVSISGTYNFFFYQLLNILGGSVTPTTNIQRSTEMRWEHQNGCAP